MSFFISFQESFGIVEVSLRFPGIVSGGKSFPFDKESVAVREHYVGTAICLPTPS